MIIKHSSLGALSSFCIVLAGGGCHDERLRGLGHTLDTAAPPAPALAEPPPLEDCEPPAARLLRADDVTRAVAADLEAAARGDRAFLRYASSAGALQARRCGGPVGQVLPALSKLLNGVSSGPLAVAPVAVDAGESPTLYRFDLRDYGLEREIELDGQRYSDGWEALIASTPYAITLVGEQAAFIAAEAATAVAWLPADALIEAVSSAPLYYALLGVPATLGELRQSVGLPPELDPLRDGLPRAAIAISRVLRAQGNMRAFDRYGTANGSYWEALQIDTTELLADPLRAQPAAQRLIAFSLPNQMLAYAVMDGAGNRQAIAQGLLDTNRDDFTGAVAVSCGNCHSQGLISFVDELGATVVGNPDLFQADAVGAYSAGPSPLERDAIVQEDSERFLAALAQGGVPTQGADPIAQIVVEATLDVDAEVAAASLFVSSETLRERLAELPPELLPLGVGLNVSRARLGSAYRSAFCTLHADDDNPPAPAECE